MKIITGRHARDLWEPGKHVKAKCFFPEINRESICYFGIHPTDLIEKCKSLVNEDEIVTVSEIVIRFFCREVRLGRMKADELEIVYYPDQSKDPIYISVDNKGDFLVPWPDNLFDEDFYLLFDSPEKE